jgi:hypothetical protein
MQIAGFVFALFRLAHRRQIDVKACVYRYSAIGATAVRLMTIIYLAGEGLGLMATRIIATKMHKRHKREIRNKSEVKSGLFFFGFLLLCHLCFLWPY